MEQDILTVGYHKGEADFSISASICDLSFSQMQEFRAMCTVAIGSAEDMWRRSRQKGQQAETKLQ